MSACPVCSGTGVVKCHKCEGAGTVVETSTPMPAGTGATPEGSAGPVKCPACHGVGTEVCRRCDGAGDVYC